MSEVPPLNESKETYQIGSKNLTKCFENRGYSFALRLFLWYFTVFTPSGERMFFLRISSCLQ